MPGSDRRNCGIQDHETGAGVNIKKPAAFAAGFSNIRFTYNLQPGLVIPEALGVAAPSSAVPAIIAIVASEVPIMPPDGLVTAEIPGLHIRARRAPVSLNPHVASLLRSIVAIHPAIAGSRTRRNHLLIRRNGRVGARTITTDAKTDGDPSLRE